MSARLVLASLLSGFALLGTATAVPATAAPAHAASTQATVHGGVAARHACTLTSTGHCIRGGEFCPQRSYGRSGWDAVGRRYVCKGSRTHPHWMKP